MSFQPELIHESVYDALRDAVRALGGTKFVGGLLWPSKSAQDAHNRCNDCLNTARPEKFCAEEMLQILRLARGVGYHGAMAFIACECGYSAPVPLAPEDERAQLQRDFIAATEALRAITQRVERAAATPLKSVAS